MKKNNVFRITNGKCLNGFLAYIEMIEDKDYTLRISIPFFEESTIRHLFKELKTIDVYPETLPKNS